MTFNRSFHLVLVCLTALGFAAACSCEGGESEKPAPAKPPAPATRPAPAPQAAAPAPRPKPPTSIKEQLEKDIDLPDFYPRDAPVYPSGRVSSVGWNRTMVSAIVSTGDSVDDVVGFLKDDLARQGWKSVSAQEMGGSSIVQGMKGDRKLSVLVSHLEEGGRTLIAITVDP